jgi:methionine-rich copper-binding protein CopC
MAIHSRFSLVAAALLALSLAACGDDSSPTGTPNDTTPPAVSSVTPVDAYHVDIAFNEQVTKGSAENESNYSIVEAAVPSPVGRGQNAAPGDPVTISGATLKNDNKTVTLATTTSMAGLSFDVGVTNVSDVTGNKITGTVSKPFTGSGTPDGTAPTVVSHTPLSAATNISIGATVTVTFSETIASASASWILGGPTASSMQAAGVGVPFTSEINGATLTLTPDASLDYSTTYTVFVAGTDNAGNAGTNTSWSFTTGANNDHTPPTLVSTSPANLATYVNADANLSMTFSEAINQGNFNVQLVPDAGSGVATWSNGGKTVTFDPDASLLATQQYTLTIFPNGVLDLAGNGIVGLHTVTFTTGAQLASGSIGGIVTGDAGSAAADPTGATVIATDSNPLNSDVFGVFSSVKVAANDTYSTPYLPDGLYYIISVKDTNGDNDLDPTSGDAIGAYGVNVATADLSPDSIAVDAGAHVTGKNFTLFDPSTASGTVQYTGAAQGDYPILVGLFDTSGFSIDDSPVVGTDAFDVDHKWSFNTLDGAFPEDNYYVGAFMDINTNGNYDPAIDPAGFYGGLPTPTTVDLENGHDNTGIVIQITDPPAMVNAPATAGMVWPKAKHNAVFQRLSEIVRQSQLQASR